MHNTSKEQGMTWGSTVSHDEFLLTHDHPGRFIQETIINKQDTHILDARFEGVFQIPICNGKMHIYPETKQCLDFIQHGTV